MSRLNQSAFVLICAIVVLATLAYGTVHQPVIALFYLSVTGLVVMWAIDCYRNGALRFSHSAIQLPLLLLGLYSIIQIIPFGTVTDASGLVNIPRTISHDPFSTQLTALHFFALSLYFGLVLTYLDSVKRLRHMLGVISVFGFLYAFYAVLQSVLSPGKIYGIYDVAFATPFGSFVNRHDFAAIIEMTIALPLGVMLTGAVARDKRLLYGVAIALMGSALLLSGSRGGLVALVAEIIVLIILTTRAKGTKNIVLKVGLSLFLAVTAVLGAVFVGGDTSLTRLTAASSSPDFTSNRAIVWRATVEMIVDNLPFGSGLGAYAQAITPYDPLSGTQRFEQAHNDYLQIIADAGVVGLVVGCLFLFMFIRLGSRAAGLKNTLRRGIAVGAFAGCSAILIHSAFDFVLHITAISVMFLTLLGMLVASGRAYEDDSDEFNASLWSNSGRCASVTSISHRQRKARGEG